MSIIELNESELLLINGVGLRDRRRECGHRGGISKQ